ncbi:MAG: type III polyketide synthase [Fibrobacter sp.]|mgnify:CR=1 FL=1|nr:type III polyketide synthase [Fibrobacter sp.]
MDAYLNSIATAVPPLALEQQQICGLMNQYYAEELSPRSLDVMKKIFLHPGIRKRHFAADSLGDLIMIRNEDPDLRALRFQNWAVSLSKEALQKAAAKAGIRLKDIDAVITNTCTGYLCPGITSYLNELLDMSDSVRVYDLAGGGCGGAIPNLQLAKALVESEKMIVAGIAVEICSATFQMGNDISLIVSNGIFGDGAAAFIFSPEKTGFKVLNSVSSIYPQYREAVRFIYKKGQLHNKLSPRLPEIIGSIISPFTERLLSGINIRDIKNWAFHPGGEKILGAAQAALSLSDDKIKISRDILKEYGNMSSPSVMFAVENFINKGVSGDKTCVLGFGAGLTIHGCILEAV